MGESNFDGYVAKGLRSRVKHQRKETYGHALVEGTVEEVFSEAQFRARADSFKAWANHGVETG